MSRIDWLTSAGIDLTVPGLGRYLGWLLDQHGANASKQGQQGEQRADIPGSRYFILGCVLAIPSKVVIYADIKKHVTFAGSTSIFRPCVCLSCRRSTRAPTRQPSSALSAQPASCSFSGHGKHGLLPAVAVLEKVTLSMYRSSSRGSCDMHADTRAWSAQCASAVTEYPVGPGVSASMVVSLPIAAGLMAIRDY